MKKLLLFITVLFFGVYSVQAQDETSYGFAQGDWILGGQATFSMNEEGDTDTTTSIIAPQAHYMLSDSWSIGASIGYSSSETDYDGEYSESATNTQIGVHGTNYVLDLGDKAQVFYRAALTYRTGDSADRTALSLGAGMAYHITGNVTLTMGLYNLLSYSTVDR